MLFLDNAAPDSCCAASARCTYPHIHVWYQQQPRFGKARTAVASFPGLSRGREGKAWGLLRAHARNIPFIFRIIRRKISHNDVIVHGESARPRGKSMRTY